MQQVMVIAWYTLSGDAH